MLPYASYAHIKALRPWMHQPILALTPSASESTSQRLEEEAPTAGRCQ
jgi:hypothetical protein